MEAHKSKMQKIRADANEKARIAQEKYQQEVQEQVRLAEEEIASYAQQRKQVED